MPLLNTDLEALLTTTPMKISEISRKLVSAETEIEGKEKSLKRIELRHLKDISAETGEDGKKKYSNEQVRAAVLEDKLVQDMEYQRTFGEILKLKAAKEEAKIDLQEQINLFSAYKAVANMKSA